MYSYPPFSSPGLEFLPSDERLIGKAVTVANAVPLANIPQQHVGFNVCLLQHYTPNVPVCSPPPTLSGGSLLMEPRRRDSVAPHIITAGDI